MNRCCLKFGLTFSLATALLSGCSKSDSSTLQSDSKTAGLKTQDLLVAKLHWIGKKRLAAESNATNFIAIWNLPESAKLEAQTLDKLSTTPWRLLKTGTPLSNAPFALLRPLLDDLVQEESYLEIRGATNQPGELVFAIRLDAARAVVWQTNLAAVLESLTGQRGTSTSAAPPTFNIQHSTFNIQISRSRDWTLLALTFNSGLKTQDSELLASFRSRIQRDQNPFAARTTNYWLAVEVDLQQVRDVFSLDWQLPDNLPEVNLTLIGDGENVRTHGELTFPEPLPIKLDPWRIPTNLIGKSLISFTAVRGVTSFLASTPLYRDWQIGPPPNQIYIWSLPFLPMQTLLAVPLKAKDDHFTQIQQRLLAAGNQWLATNSTGQFTNTEGRQEVTWQGLPLVSPFVRTVVSDDSDFICLGLLPPTLTNLAGHVELAGRVLARTNAVYYDWEFTGPRIESWFYVGQLFRLIFRREQLTSNSPVTAWLKALQSKLSNSGTVVTYAEPSRLSFERNSTLGLTAFELHLFADWIESPEFPWGLHTSLVRMKRKLGPTPVSPSVVPADR